MTPRLYTSLAGLGVPRLVADLLRGHVGRRADDAAGLRWTDPRSVGGPLGQAEVGDVRAAFPVDQYVGRLEVAVEDAVLMGVVDGPADEGETAGRVARFHRAVGQHAGQGPTLHQRHGEVGPAVALAGVVDGDDVGMVEEGGGADFRLEAGKVFRRGELAAQDHLQGDGALEAAVPGPVDDAHAAAAQLFQEVIVAEGSRERRRGGCGRGTFRAERTTGTTLREGVGDLHGRPQLAQFLGQVRAAGGGALPRPADGPGAPDRRGRRGGRRGAGPVPPQVGPTARRSWRRPSAGQQRGPQPAHRPQVTHRRRGLVDAERGGRFLIGQLLAVPQQNHLAVGLRQGGDGRF